MTKAETLREVLQTWLGTEYKWGGDSPDGIDCSGLVLELLWSIGAFPEGDRTAAGIHSVFMKAGLLSQSPREGIDSKGLGSVAFFSSREDGSITHCELVVCRLPLALSIGARGGKSIEGFIKVRPVKGRRTMKFIAYGDTSRLTFA